jgi:hypothetical protein
MTPFIKMSKISAQKGKKQFFVDEWSPESIGLPDPFREKFWELWNKGEKETAKQYGRKERYITNIKVLKDPANPENEGKFFLFDMSKTLFDKVKNAMVETEAMKALGEEAIPVFDPINGNSFLLKVKMGTNKILTYEDSKFADKSSAVFENEEEALAFIKENCYELKEFLQPEFYKSYEELLDLRDRFFKEGKYSSENDKSQGDKDDRSSEKSNESKEEPEVKTGLEKTKSPKKEEPKKESEPSVDDELDDLLNELM